MSNSSLTRLEQQIGFLLEIDRLKTIFRQSYILHADRHENTAEHSWHLAMAALVLAEHADGSVDVCRVMKMAVVHDLVEIDAGDTFAYDDKGNARKAELERKAADRIFGLLPADQGSEIRSLWEEFEAGVTADSRFANAIDRVLPVLHNIHTDCRSWREHGVTADRVLAFNGKIANGSTVLWDYIRGIIEQAAKEGRLAR